MTTSSKETGFPEPQSLLRWLLKPRSWSLGQWFALVVLAELLFCLLMYAWQPLIADLLGIAAYMTLVGLLAMLLINGRPLSQ